ncbi:TROVE domain-containing protein [Actinomadura sp. KC345]|uniref:TROVE domain-containing protein n=1 Tax=Actinomadura sp. KC345 TaxID=2530371 RepID=UPI00104E0258|nr:TROVE domain-containing protein [Actinomadura sp. KC345]TDC55044.1 TROVE domain-containing protein [Actinomadura sp. KC345]
MAKFNRGAVRPAASSPVKTEDVPTGRTHEGAPGHARSDARSELFLLAVANMVGENTFYEQAGDRDARFRDLVHRVAVDDADWMAGFLPWLRGEGNMRSASLVAALEAVRARLAAGLHGGNRQLVSSVIQRADEPGEALAYWIGTYGRAIPKPVKRGIGDAILRLGTEFNYVKWGSEGRGIGFADVLNLTHPGDRKGSSQAGRFQGPWQHDLFGYVVKRPHQPDTPIPESLETLTRRDALLSMPVDERRQVLEHPELLARAGITWEALAGWLQGPMDAAAWEAIIPSMGIFALVRNLRNFDQAGVSDAVAERVAAKLADPEVIARSRMFPFRFLAAHNAAPSLRWAWPLEQALNHSLANVPRLDGRTLVLVDRSGSMFGGVSQKSGLDRADSAAVFGTALALRAASADLVEFGTSHQRVEVRRGESLLKALERFHSLGGTNTAEAVRAHYGGHDRVVIVTDEQAWGGHRGADPTGQVPAEVPVYTWNLAGYRYGHGPSGDRHRHTFGGLSDAAFRQIPLLEASRSATWPWL